MPRSTVVSSPGKVLLAGGYLVLDPRYPGVVVSTSSRFYTAVSESDAAATAGPPAPVQIRVRSPQFVDAVWVYLATIDDGGGVRIEQVADGCVSLYNASPISDDVCDSLIFPHQSGASATKNRFVQLALERTLLLAQETQGSAALKERLQNGLDIAIVGDNDFYSQRKQVMIYCALAMFEADSGLIAVGRTRA